MQAHNSNKIQNFCSESKLVLKKPTCASQNYQERRFGTQIDLKVIWKNSGRPLQDQFNLAPNFTRPDHFVTIKLLKKRSGRLQKINKTKQKLLWRPSKFAKSSQKPFGRQKKYPHRSLLQVGVHLAKRFGHHLLFIKTWALHLLFIKTNFQTSGDQNSIKKLRRIPTVKVKLQTSGDQIPIGRRIQTSHGHQKFRKSQHRENRHATSPKAGN